MKRFFLTLVGILSVCSFLFAKQIDVRTAQTVAQTFLSGTSNLRSTSSLNLVYTCKDETLLRSGQTENYYYVFNIGNNQGFIIISADDVNVPIIGYSTTGKYDTSSLPPNFKGWIDEVATATKAGISQNASAEENTTQEWNDYKSGKVPMSLRAATSVAPFVKTKWNQTSPYNQLVVSKVGSNTPYTGCTATAMAQIMKYHSHPAKGIKATEAYKTSLGTNIPSEDLTKVTYNWANMSEIYNNNSTTAQKNEVAKLMYHVGISARMDYTPSGSGASLYRAALALIQNFNYHPSLQYIQKGTTPATEWKNKIKEELTAKRPILYAGYSTSGHAFVCEGYDKNGLFAFNWGWGNYLDGYFNIDALIVGGRDYSQRHEMIMGIKPNTGNPIFYMTLSSALYTYDTTSQKVGGTFNTRIYLKNTGNAKFQGYYTIALTDASGNVKYILDQTQSTTLVDINANEYIYKNATCLIPTNAVTGTYYVRAVYKAKGTTAWKVVDKGSTPNSIKFTVIGTPNLAHTKGLTTNATSKKFGESFTTTVTIKNTGKGKFEGYHAIALTDASGNVKYILNTKQSTTLATININGTYTKTETCLIPTNATPGTYYVRFVQKEKGTTAWKAVNTGTSPYYITFAVTGTPYLTHTKGLTTNATSKKFGESFTTTVTIKNTGKGKFEGYHAIALTDANGYVKYILNTKQSTTLATINVNGTYTKTETCLIPTNATPGTYYVRFVQKEKGTTVWKALSVGTSPYYVRFTVAANTCTTPSGLSTSSITNNKATLKWNAVSGAQSYTLQYRKNSTTTWTTISSSLKTTTYNLTGLAASTAYTWQVRANCSSTNNSAYASASFTTTKAVSACINNYEPNETMATAYSIYTNRVYSAGIGSETDKDYYKFTLTAKSNVVATLQNLPTDYDLYIYNSAGTQLGQSRKSGTNDESISLPNLAAGTYYVYVYGFNKRYDLQNCYSLKISTTAVQSTRAAIEEEVSSTSLLEVYPNPVSDILYIKTGGAPIKRVMVTNISGKVVLRENHNGNSAEIYLRDLPVGVYIVTVETEKGIISKRIQKQ